MEKGFWLQAMDDGTSVCVTVCMVVYEHICIIFPRTFHVSACINVLICVH